MRGVDPTGPVAVVGATGQQGGAVADALLDRGIQVRAVVRDAAKGGALERRGARLAVADLTDPASLHRAFDGVGAVFAMTTMTGPGGVDAEVTHGRALADAAHVAQVPHLVYSSVGGAERHTGIPHFESKRQVELYLHEVGVPTSVIRPTFFMENFSKLLAPQIEDGVLVLRAPLAPGVPLQMVAVADIGQAAASALLRPDAVPDGAVEIAGDERTAEQISEVFGRAYALPARFEPLSPSVLEDDDAEAMFAWFATTPSYTADLAVTRSLVGRVTDLPTIAARQRPPG